MTLVIDNYDSFTFNLVQMVGAIDSNIIVKRNDTFTLDEIKYLNPSKIIISPGPGKPNDAGLCKDVIKYLGKDIPILGVCLGHQAIGEAFGAKIRQSNDIFHGKISNITHFKDRLFNDIEEEFSAARYHSLIIDGSTLPNTLKKIAQLQDGTIMGVKHKVYPIIGIQFHPESYSTDCGSQIIKNFFNYTW